MSNTLVSRGAITAVMLIALLFVAYVLSFEGFTEFKNSVRSIGVVRHVQNFLYHLEHPRLSAVAVGDGLPASEIVLVEPVSVAEGPDGSVYISDRHHRIWQVGDDGIATVLAGNGYKGAISNRGEARESRLGIPEGLAVDRQGRVYFADSYNDVVARVDEAGVIEIVAGTGVRGFDAETGPATEVGLNKPYDVAVDDDGALYIIDNLNHRLRKVAPDGIMSTIVGAGDHEPTEDPQASETANLLLPWGVFVDSLGRVYVADGGHHVIRRVNLDGTIETVAGNGTAGYAGDGGPAVAAKLNVPQSMFLRQDGSLLIEDEHNHVIRLVDPGGTITTIAGIGKPSDVLETKDVLRIGLNDPEDTIELRDGSILIADRLNRRVVSIRPDGTAAIFAGRRNRTGAQP
jgi:sugar lactone lactonase YvrE